MQPQHDPTPDGDDATTGRHYQDAPVKFGVGCLIKVYASAAGHAGKHARPEPPGEYSHFSGDVTNATAGGTR